MFSKTGVCIIRVVARFRVLNGSAVAFREIREEERRRDARKKVVVIHHRAIGSARYRALSPTKMLGAGIDQVMVG